ncbi:tRNA (adenosine(37)-N6)-threonylcarbamoyltransferase complex transferase subunit TsaD [candidate division KSB1 bacterium]|nr:tRNA (adenosine(37)-N6)-threonylcarbamoyltransferase complex transferase subunit TsaD [candidate division KSB1 bacterium]RQV99921.1 MAG: tRNA (adenosine(37)-N6)-threonylcarbamoyltransferase complex transferase subunit TsaD [candidate division KSB1 bacterium]
MVVLGIETSCDETSAAIVNDEKILSNIITTQVIHEEYGGVVPEFASRAHVKQLVPIIKIALEKANVTLKDIDGIAVTYGPGLAGSLLIGLCVAKGLSLSLKIPFIGVNHIEGHILAVAANNPDMVYPFIALVASGGHTILVYIEKPFSYKIVGQTIDDAAGEAFDKVAKMLGLGYPGGPIIEKVAREGKESAINFPRALMDQDNLDFSFSGLKTSVLYYVQKKKQHVSFSVADVAASFQKAVVDVLVEKSSRALGLYQSDHLVLAGGVIRNARLCTAFKNMCKEQHIHLDIPTPVLCTDNAGMVARAGHLRLQRGERSDYSLDVAPNLSLDALI